MGGRGGRNGKMILKGKRNNASNAPGVFSHPEIDIIDYIVVAPDSAKERKRERSLSIVDRKITHS